MAFILAARPRKGTVAVSDLHWILGSGCLLAEALVLMVIAKGSDPVRKAVLLSAAAGNLVGLQASLTQGAVHVLSHRGFVALLMTWNGYAVLGRGADGHAAGAERVRGGAAARVLIPRW